MITFHHYLIQATCLEEVPSDIERLQRELEIRHYNRVFSQKLQMEAYRNADWDKHHILTIEVNNLMLKEHQYVCALAELKEKLS